MIDMPRDRHYESDSGIIVVLLSMATATLNIRTFKVIVTDRWYIVY